MLVLGCFVLDVILTVAVYFAEKDAKRRWYKLHRKLEKAIDDGDVKTKTREVSSIDYTVYGTSRSERVTVTEYFADDKYWQGVIRLFQKNNRPKTPMIEIIV